MKKFIAIALVGVSIFSLALFIEGSQPWLAAPGGGILGYALGAIVDKRRKQKDEG